MDRPHLYLAGGLFNLAERARNATLEEALLELGYRVILPQQREALAFKGEGGKFDLVALRAHCRKTSEDRKNIVVACLDGTDADSGTVVELTYGSSSTGRAIAYRTDFRTMEEQEIGVNAMLLQPEVSYIYHPCFATEANELQRFYRELARKIDRTATFVVSAGP